jgi:hypothetical protein
MSPSLATSIPNLEGKKSYLTQSIWNPEVVDNILVTVPIPGFINLATCGRHHLWLPTWVVHSILTVYVPRPLPLQLRVSRGRKVIWLRLIVHPILTVYVPWPLPLQLRVSRGRKVIWLRLIVHPILTVYVPRPLPLQLRVSRGRKVIWLRLIVHPILNMYVPTSILKLIP